MYRNYNKLPILFSKRHEKELNVCLGDYYVNLQVYLVGLVRYARKNSTRISTVLSHFVQPKPATDFGNFHRLPIANIIFSSTIK